jgi:site-specific DNA-cytosine methylase
VVGWNHVSRTVTGTLRVDNGPAAVADVRVSNAFDSGYGVLKWQDAARTIAGTTAVGCGAYAVSDVRVGTGDRVRGSADWSASAKAVYGTLVLEEPAGRPDSAGTAPHEGHDDVGVADAALDPRKAPPFTPVIIASDGTWHRPLTTLELAALQGLPLRVNNQPLKLAGDSHSSWRERIGNAVPPPAARAVAERMLVTLTESALGTMSLSNEQVWVEPLGHHPYTSR